MTVLSGICTLGLPQILAFMTASLRFGLNLSGNGADNTLRSSIRTEARKSPCMSRNPPLDSTHKIEYPT